MATHTIRLDVPSELYERLKQRAAHAQRSVEAELLSVVQAAVRGEDELPPDLADALIPLTSMDDAELWQAAGSHLPDGAARRLEALNLKRQREGLTEREERVASSLLRQYERFMLIRAEAAALLKRRGHDVSGLLASR